MHGLPENIDLLFFHQRLLQQICLGEYQVQLRFDTGISVDVEANFTLDEQKCGVKDAYLLHHLLGLSVQSATREGVGDLRLWFGDHLLILHDSNANYESYTIHTHAGPIIV